MRWMILFLALLPASTILADEKDEMVAKQRAFAMETLKKCSEVPQPAAIETADLIVCGPFPEEKLKAIGAVVQKNYATAMKALKFEMTDNPPAGKVAVYLFPERKPFALFVGEVLNERLDKNERSHVDGRRKEPFVAISVFPGDKPTDLDAEASKQVAIALLQAKGGTPTLPGWVQEGFARAMKMRTDPGKTAADRTWIRSNYRQAKVSDAWASADKSNQLVATSVMEYFVFGPGAPKLTKFLSAFRQIEGDPKPTVDAALTAVDLTPEKLEAAWKKFVQTGK